MNSIFQKHAWLRYVVGGFIIALGILVIILASLSLGKLPEVVNIVVASSCLLLGVFLLCSIILSETHKLFTLTMVACALLITAGVTLLVARFALHFTIQPNILVYSLAIFKLAFALVCLGKTVSLIFYKEKGSWIFLMIVVTLACIALGVLSLVFANKLMQTAYIILGVSLIVVGVLFIVFSMMNSKKRND